MLPGGAIELTRAVHKSQLQSAINGYRTTKRCNRRRCPTSSALTASTGCPCLGCGGKGRRQVWRLSVAGAIRPQRPAFDQSGVQPPKAEARNLSDQNMDSGCVIVVARGPVWRISWPNTRTLAELADEMEFEAIVPVARWRGFGGCHQPAGARVSKPTPGRRESPARPAGRGVVATSHARSTIRSSPRNNRPTHRPHYRRPYDPQHRHRLEQARDRHVRRRDARPRRARDWPRKARLSSRGCGPRTRNSTTRAGTIRY